MMAGSPCVIPSVGKQTWKMTQVPKPTVMTLRGPNASDNEPESQPANPAIRPYAANTHAALFGACPREIRYGARYPDSTPSPTIKRNNPRYPQASCGGMPMRDKSVSAFTFSAG